MSEMAETAPLSSITEFELDDILSTRLSTIRLNETKKRAIFKTLQNKFYAFSSNPIGDRFTNFMNAYMAWVKLAGGPERYTNDHCQVLKAAIQVEQEDS